MKNKPKLAVTGYDARHGDFNTPLEMEVTFTVVGLKGAEATKYINDILLAIQELDIKKR